MCSQPTRNFICTREDKFAKICTNFPWTSTFSSLLCPEVRILNSYFFSWEWLEIWNIFVLDLWRQSVVASERVSEWIIEEARNYYFANSVCIDGGAEKSNWEWDQPTKFEIGGVSRSDDVVPQRPQVRDLPQPSSTHSRHQLTRPTN